MRTKMAPLLAGFAATLVLAACGGDEEPASSLSPTPSSTVELPPQKTKDLDLAVKAAGCTLTESPSAGQDHKAREFTIADYETNPPTSGPHFPEWANDGPYRRGNTPPLGHLVHTLEHGRINLQYAPGADEQVVRQLEALFLENDGYHMLLYQNETGVDAEVAATAWTKSLTCRKTTDATWDALRTFRDEYIDKAPEKVP